MIDRNELFEVLKSRLAESRALAVLGARQVGKSTLARAYAKTHQCVYFDLEDPHSRVSLAQPMATLSTLLAQRKTVVLDGVQSRPELFPVLRTLIDQYPQTGQFLLLGSASPLLTQPSGESLAGRVSLLSISGLSLAEVSKTSANDVERANQATQLWLRGGFPRAMQASSPKAALRWLRDYLTLVIERDVPQLGLKVAAPVLQRFWRLLSHYHGKTWNAADPARSLGVSEPTVRKYLDFMTGLQLVRQLPPWHEGLSKRQVKTPRIYIRDSGLLHYLWGVTDCETLLHHPQCAASWEGFALEQVLHIAQPDEAYFWATHAGATLDLLMFKHGLRIGVEFKRVDTPKMTASMHIALQDLKLDALYVVYPGERRYTLTSTRNVPATVPVEAIPLTDLAHLWPDWS